MRFHLIDRIVDFTARESIHARKATSLSEDYWTNSAMPSYLVLEAICQAGTWMIMASTDRKQRAALVQVGDLTVHGTVVPGDVLEIYGETKTFTNEIAVLDGRAEVTGRLVLSATDIMCSLLDADELAGRDDSERMLAMLMCA